MSTMQNITTSIHHLAPRFDKLELPVTLDIPLWFTVAFSAINGGGFCLNSLSLWLLATRRFVYRGKVNIFVISLCISDLIVSMSSFYFLMKIKSQDMRPFSRRVATMIFSFALQTSLMSLSSLSYERLTAVRKPFQYQEILSSKRVIVMMAFGWTFCICLLAMQFLFAFIYRNERYIYLNWIIFIALSIASIVFLSVVYFYLIYEIHRHSTHMKSCTIPEKTKDSFSMSNISQRCDHISNTIVSLDEANQTKLSLANYAIGHYMTRGDESRDSMDKPKHDKHDNCHILHAVISNSTTSRRLSTHRHRRLSARDQLMKKERRSVILCICIVTIFAASWFPVTVFFIRCLISHSCEADDHLLFVCSCLVSLNSFLNPVLYFIIKREFRDFFNGKMCRQSRRRESGESKRGSTSVFL